MEKKTYMKYVMGTVDMYSNKLKKHLISIFSEKNLIVKENKKVEIILDDESKKDINGLSYGETLYECLDKNQKAVKIFEKWEFTKDFKYSIMLEVDDFDELLNKVERVQPIDEKDACIRYEGNFFNPILYVDNSYVYLKFNLLYSSYNIEESRELLLKYPFVVVFNKKYKIIEFRFDTIKSMYLNNRQDNYIYRNFVNNMIRYFKDTFDVILYPMDLSFFRAITQEERQDIKLVAQYMRLRNGGQAQLEVGNNEEYLLPFIDELVSLMHDYADELNKVPNFKQALEGYISESINMSDYPWVEFMWVNDIAAKNNKVRFTFNYMGETYTLMQHMYSPALIGMERMNHVTEYVIENREDCE